MTGVEKLHYVKHLRKEYRRINQRESFSSAGLPSLRISDVLVC